MIFQIGRSPLLLRSNGNQGDSRRNESKELRGSSTNEKKRNHNYDVVVV